MYRYIVLSFTILVVAVFVVFIFLNENTKQLFSGEYEERILGQLQNEVIYEARVLEYTVKQVQNKMNFLVRKHQELFDHYDEAPLFDINIVSHENGSLYKADDSGSSVYYSGLSPQNEYTLNKMKKTEALDEYYRDVLSQTNLISQVYINTWDHMNRLMPHIPNVSDVFGGMANVTEYNFYYLADEVHNPERKPVWTQPYLDPAGMGWIISLVAPIYSNEWLEGVVGLDIPLDNIRGNILEESKVGDKALMVINQAGYIVSYNNKAQETFDINTLNSQIQHKDNVDIMLPDSMKLLSATGINLSDLSYEKPMKINDYLVSVAQVENIGWHLLILSDYDDVTSSLFEKDKQVNQLTITVILLLILSTCIVTLFYIFRIRKMSSRISNPIKILSDQVKHFAIQNMELKSLESTGIEEIDSLNHEFTIMGHEIKHRTDQLIEAQIQKRQADEEAKRHLIDATTDALTQVNNRRKFDDLLDSELNRSSRYHSEFCLILLDVDSFKEINDYYGHAKGDEVLKGVAKILKSSLRASDVVARWGGDEFVIMIVESDLDNGLKIAEKIRKNVSSYYKDGMEITISIGITQVELNKDDARSLLQKADKALYGAKRQGKNCVVSFKNIGEPNEE